MVRVTIAALAAGLIGISPVHAKDTNPNAVVKIHVTQRPPDLFRPWTKASSRKTAGTGVIIAGRRILTNAHVAQYASQIFVQPNQSTDKIPASVLAIAPQVDLAVLRLEDESLLDERAALPLAQALPSVKDTVNVYGYPIGGDDLSVTAGIVSRIEYASYSRDTGGLRIQVDAALNPGNSGGPAVKDGHIVGLVFSKISKADNIGYLIPVEEINTFLADVEDGTYDGKPTLYDELQTTENEALRDKLGLQTQMGGVLVRQPYGRDDTYPLKPWDVITHIGPHPLDNLGNVRIENDLRLDFRYMVPQLATENTVGLTVLRDGATIDVSVPVRRKLSLLIPSLDGAYPRHFIYGPLPFTSATQEFVGTLAVQTRLYLSLTAGRSPLVTRHFDRPAFDGEELVVVPNRMFSHRITKGYDNMPFGVVQRVNDVPIKNLRHLVTQLRDADEDFITFDMAGSHETLVFRRSEIEACMEEILEDEGIRYQCSPDLRDVWRTDQ